MKTFLFALALVFAVIGGAVGISTSSSTPAYACDNTNPNCAKPSCTGSNC